MKYTKFFIFSILLSLVFFFVTLSAISSCNPDLIRNIAHFYSAIFLVFSFTFLTSIAVGANVAVKTSDILWGVGETIALSIIWEVFFQGFGRLHHGNRFYIQWDQIMFDILGALVALIIWLIKRRKFLTIKKDCLNN